MYKELLNTPITPPNTTVSVVAKRAADVQKMIISHNSNLTDRQEFKPEAIAEAINKPVTAALKKLVNPNDIAQTLINQAVGGNDKCLNIILDRIEGKVTDKVEVTDNQEKKSSIVAALQEMTKVLNKVEEIKVVKEVPFEPKI
jgi:hypothetical protein